MKQRNLLFSIVRILVLTFFISCNEEAEEAVPPIITAASPIIGPPGLVVQITGTNFDNNSENNLVFFGGEAADVAVASSTTLNVTVPEQAVTGEIVVWVNDQSALGPVFTITPRPEINSFSPSQATVGALVTIEGVEFFGFQGEIDSTYVLFNGVVGDIKQSSNTRIIVEVPPNAISGTITVGLRGVELDAGTFEVDAAQLNYEDDITVSSVISIESLSNVFVTSMGEVLVSTDDQILQLHSDNSLTTIAGIDGSSSLMDGAVSEATFGNPYQVIENTENDFFVNDIGEGVIRRIVGGEVSTYYSNDELFFLFGIATEGNERLYLTDLSSKIWSLNGSLNLEARVALSGGSGAVGAITINEDGNIYAVYGNQVVRVTPDDFGTVFAGRMEQGIQDGMASEAAFNGPLGITVGPDGNIYVADTENSLIRKITPGGNVSTVAGMLRSGMVDGDQNTAKFVRPTSIHFDNDGNMLVVDDESTLRKIEFN